MGEEQTFVNRLIEEHRNELERVCRLRRVKKIELFGSAAGPQFDPEHSDLDFLVTFRDRQKPHDA
jgi:uncharacterized protein